MKLNYWLKQLFLFILFILPVIAMALFSYRYLERNLNEVTLMRRTAMAELAATFIDEKLNHLVDLGKALATRRQFLRHVESGRWDDAIKITEHVPSDFPFISRVSIVDIDGTLKASTPGQHDLVGKSLSNRDWHKGVRRNWQPYVSEVFQAMYGALPNVVAVATPVKNDAGIPVGILVLLIKLDVFSGWINNYKIDGTGFLFVVDQKGQLVAHKKFAPQGEIIDFSMVPSAQKVLRGEEGWGIFYNPVEKELRLSAFRPVPSFGWGCVVTQPKKDAFMLRDKVLTNIFIGYAIIILFSALTAIFILKQMAVRRVSEEKVRVLNKELSYKVKQLKDVNKELETFAYSVSHDLRAPLRSIDGFSKIILEESSDKLDENAINHFNRIRAASGRMAELINDLLLLSRVSRNELRIEKIDLSAIVQKISQDLRSRQPQRMVEFHIAGGIFAYGDSVLLENVLVNLMENSWKFTSKHASANIEFGVLNEGKKRVYFVRDDGAGFDLKYADKLFGAFQRMHTHGEFDGLGIGLATVSRILHRHGGSIWADSAVEKGAVFYFTLGDLA